MAIHLRAKDIIDPETEAHYSFKTIRPLSDSHGRITTTIFHDHDFYELFLIHYGRIRHLVNNRDILLATGTLVFIRPADCHSFKQHEREDCGLINLAFPEHTLTALLAYLGEGFTKDPLLEPISPPTILLNENERHTTITRLTNLQQVPYTKKKMIRTHLRLLVADLMGKYFILKKNMDRSTSQNWLQELCFQMQNPDNMRAGVPKMQALANSSPEHLSRTFRKELGITPTQFINKLRLTYAANLLFNTDQEIVDVSYEVGLDNLSYFYRLFKQQYGMTPAQFRNQKSKGPIP